MKKAINVRIDENMILTLEKLSKEMCTTKTDIIEKAIKLFSKQYNKQNNSLMQFAGILDENEAKTMLDNINSNNSSKDFKVDF